MKQFCRDMLGIFCCIYCMYTCMFCMEIPQRIEISPQDEWEMIRHACIHVPPLGMPSYFLSDPQHASVIFAKVYGDTLVAIERDLPEEVHKGIACHLSQSAFVSFRGSLISFFSDSIAVVNREDAQESWKKADSATQEIASKWLLPRLGHYSLYQAYYLNHRIFPKMCSKERTISVFEEKIINTNYDFLQRDFLIRVLAEKLQYTLDSHIIKASQDRFVQYQAIEQQKHVEQQEHETMEPCCKSCCRCPVL
jgi:hypothetical protein